MIRPSKQFVFSVVIDDDAPVSRSQAVLNRIRQRARKSCTKKLLHKRLPFLTWMPKYNADDAVGDLVAGITVGLTVIPQSLAYGNLAGLPPQVCITGCLY
jgi:sodium-independent sulfate anion transporter 11